MQPQDLNIDCWYVETNTHDTPARPKYRSPVFGNKYIRHTYKTQIFTGCRHVETDIQHTYKT